MQKISDIPLQLDELQQAELAREFQTVEGFLSGRPRRHLPSGQSGKEQAYTALLEYVRCSVAPAVCSGAALLATLRSTRLLPSGCESLDKGLLKGGLREGHHTEVAGESGSGKTQLCIQMAAQTALRGERVIYIDTDGSFSGRRFAAIHERLSGGNPGADLVAALRCVDLFRVYDLHSLLELLSALQARLKDDQSGQLVALLVIDSLSFLVAPMLSSAEVNGHALMVCLGRLVKQIAQRFSLVALTTNHIVGGYEDVRPALGETWKAQAHLRLVLTCKGPTLRKATLAACSIAPCGGSVFLDLCVGGLVSNSAPGVG
ncbi:DNA repair protein RAD51 homolog 4 [Coccomyxa sp. Obi]|nr:DNA repair protein RAD51 homolog 4 [Coccomyxa sp. Obi]